jgi:hypothetical protein
MISKQCIGKDTAGRSIATRIWIGRPRNVIRFPAGTRDFTSFAIASRQAMGSTNSDVQRIQWAL